NRDEFLARYHRRSNVESVFSAMKRKFRDTLRSKTPIAQRNELLLMALCHNVCCVIHEIHESGATPMFPSLSDCRPKKAAVAQQILDWRD
ncbi:MAG TPA: transposase, partial [Vicinamibacterales bacterium]